MGMFSAPEARVLTAEEEEEQLIMRRMRNAADELKNEYRRLDSRFAGMLAANHSGQDSEIEDQGGGQQVGQGKHTAGGGEGGTA